MTTCLAKMNQPSTNTIITLRIKKPYNEETHNIDNIDKTETCNITNNRYTDEHDYKNKM